MFEIIKSIIYTPLYNGLILLMDIIPFADLGIAVIVFTLIIKFILFPLSKKAVKTQLEMKKIQPELDELKEKHKDNNQVYAQKMLELYREKEINPFSTIFLTLIQIPIIISLYYVFLKSGFPDIRLDLLYSFIPAPKNVDVMFLGIINLTGKSYVLALIASITTYFQMKYAMPVPNKKTKPGQSFKDDLARSMSVQMRYIFPVIVAFIAYGIGGVVALYWITSNLFTIAQEIYMRRTNQK